MTVTLTPRAEALLRSKIETGSYHDAGEVIERALHLLDAHDRRVQQLRESVAEGFAAIDRGEGIELTPELMDERGRRAEERARRGETPHADVCP